jgi:hypothetical protein
MLRVIQLNTLEDRSVSEKQHWDSAVKFLENSVKEKLQVQYTSFVIGGIFCKYLLSESFMTFCRQLEAAAVHHVILHMSVLEEMTELDLNKTNSSISFQHGKH